MAKYEAIPIVVDAYVITAVVVKDGPLRHDGGNEREFTVFFGESKVRLQPEMVARMEPKVGDYYVVQEDGYAYINPKNVFERKYRAMN